MKDEAELYRGKMVEKAAESDDALLEKYLESGELSQEEIMRGLRAGCISGKIVPVLCGASPRLIGVAQLINVIDMLMPSPAEKASRAPVKAKDVKTGSEVVRKGAGRRMS